MSKKTPVKKSKRRLKRSVRRSLAAVLMITAIGVAAIPVPENYAATENDEAEEVVTTAYDYPKDLDKLTMGMKLSPASENDVHKTYNISLIEDVDGSTGTYRLEWQYKYFRTKISGSGNQKDIICGYNNDYQKPELLVYLRPVTAYVEVSVNVFNSFKTTEKGYVTSTPKGSEGTGDAKWYYLPADPKGDTGLKDSERQDLTTYFDEEYKQRVVQWDAYQAYNAKYQPEYKKLYDAAVNAGGTIDTEALQEQAIANLTASGVAYVAKPEATWLSCMDFKYDWQWQRFYCDRKSGYRGCTLEKVLNSENGDDTASGGSSTTSSKDSSTVYIPRVLDEKLYNEEPYDAMGFMWSTKADIIGIGDGVFKDVQNVGKVILPENLKYIGDSAFENSYITSITMDNVEEIGNQAFKNCPYLSDVTLGKGVAKIGTEAFYGVSQLKEIKFPGSIAYIGSGSFANCNALGTIDMSAVTTMGVVIDDYAFYDDVALSTINWVRTDSAGTDVNIVSIGDAAFAVKGTVTGSLTEFKFPAYIDRNKGTSEKEGSVGLGDYILAGRTNLQSVTMPSYYGSNTKAKIPNHIFYNCINMKELIFPDTGASCGSAQYDKDLFASVSNPEFIVQGPKYTNPSNRTPAEPRRSTWTAYTAVSDVVPYVYYENGKKYIEVSDGEYLECIDDSGMLISCSLNPDIEYKKYGSVDLIIPAEVAGVKVKGISSDCFAADANEYDDEKSERSRKMCKVVRSLTLKDGSEIATINASVFANWIMLDRVYIGDSVREIGANAFQNCNRLIDVYFNTPESAAAEFKELGANAFQTNSTELTFHGIINSSYKPFTWATAPERTIDTNNFGIRICYKSLAPSYLTVLRDNTDYTHADGTKEKLLTLVDYPKYDQIARILGESCAVRNGVYMSGGLVYPNKDSKRGVAPEDYYQNYMESYYYTAFSGTQYDAKRAAFREKWESIGTDAYNDFTVYGPWVTPNFCETYQQTSISSNEGAGSITDWLFKPITVYAAGGSPDPYFKTYKYNVYDFFEGKAFSEVYGRYQTWTDDEWNLWQATKVITLPDGIQSVDVSGYIPANKGNAANYLSPEKLGDTWAMYHKANSNVKDHDTGLVSGLFSGEYDDKVVYPSAAPDGEAGTENIKGNDRLEKINLNQVVYLPDYAFDNCENLKEVTIGEDCEKMGALPFRGCTSLTDLNVAAENQYFAADNRILYSRNKDNASYTLVECLESKGKNNNPSIVTETSDPYIALVSSIAEAAFEKCDYVSRVNLEAAKGLSEIPASCFKSCKALTEVDLPDSVRKIEKEAFYNTLLGRLKIPGKEVFISTDAFQYEANKQQPTYVYTYDDTAARRYVATYGDSSKYNLVFEDIGNIWYVRFYDRDGKLISETTVEAEPGKALRLSNDQIPDAPIHEGYTFDGWVGTGGVNPQNDAITQDTDFIASYYSSNGMVNGKWVVNFIDGVTGEAFWPTQVEDGEAADEPPYTPVHEGYKFLKFSADFSKVTSNMTIVALYGVDGTVVGPGGSSTTSGGTTNSGNKTTSGSSSSTTTSGSSTSTTSSTGEKPRHTVTVVNGFGSGSYAEGETVIIVANEPAAGQKFSQWRTESEGVELVMILASATTFVMPANNVLVTAEFTAGTAPASTTPAPTVGKVSTSPGSTGTTNNNNGNTRVDITKPGISNKNLATANVNGSTDNFIVKISETPEATQSVVNALLGKYGNLDNILYYAMDISLYDSTGTTKITDTTGLSVDITIPLPDALVTYGGNNMMGAVVAADQLEDISERFTTIGGVPCISFTATHFSPYTVYVNTQNLSEGLLDVTPKTGDPIHPKWFLSVGLAALSILLFMKKDKKTTVKTA